MKHVRITFGLNKYYHILASSNVDTIGELPNGIASVFMWYNEPESKPSSIIINKDEIENNKLGEDIALDKMIKILSEKHGYIKPTNIIVY